MRVKVEWVAESWPYRVDFCADDAASRTLFECADDPLFILQGIKIYDKRIHRRLQLKSPLRSKRAPAAHNVLNLERVFELATNKAIVQKLDQGLVSGSGHPVLERLPCRTCLLNSNLLMQKMIAPMPHLKMHWYPSNKE